MGPYSSTHARTRFYRQIRIDRKISFILVYNSACFRVFWMGQISVKVGGLLVFLLFAFCGSVKAVGDGSEDQNNGFAGHPPPFLTCSINK